MGSKKFLKKFSSAVMASALALNTLAVVPVFAEGGKYEFEEGTLVDAKAFDGDKDGNAVANSSGQLVFLQDAGETATVTVNVKEAGMYTLTIATYTPYGAKTHNLLINDVDQGQISFVENTEGVVETELGKFKLNAGDNTITVKSSWGWTYLDYIRVDTASLPAITSSNKLSDSKAISATQSLMNYLADVYGKHIISGQQEIYQYGPHDFEWEFEYIKEKTGEYPAIRGFDYGNFTCPAFGSDDGSTTRIIDWVKNKNGIATSSWHLNVPTDFASYTSGSKVDWSQTTYSEKTDFSPSKAATPGTKENEYYMQALTTLAAEFKKLEAENIPVIWRPLHEAEGGGGETGSWFWWGREGSEAYKKLWIYTYKTLTEDFDCHNLIWEWNSYAYATSKDWYPGDEYVDLIAYDKYNCTDWSSGNPVLIHNDSAISGTFYNLVDMYEGKKMIAMSENDSIPTLENLLTEKAGWLYFCPWYDGGSDNINFLSNPVFNTVEDLTTMYQSDYCISLDELPENLYSYESSGNTDPTDPTDPIVTTATTAKPSGTTTTKTTTTTEPAPEPEVYKLAIKTNGGKKLDVTININPASYELANGCFGYADGKDWISTEWEVTEFDKDGNAVVSFDIPEGVENLEFQIWWPNSEAKDVKCVATSYSIDGKVTDIETSTGSSVYGDVNNDGKVEIADVVALAAYVGDPDNNAVNAQGLVNGDVQNTGDGITSGDVLAIQQYLANIVTELPIK
ncbi:MAG: glycosyl hydrolase [Oscillospiraceae bacterium]|nr:glycosyl hydrolase [Oscillospiraceae bacterium]